MAIYVNGELISDDAVKQEIQRMKPHYDRMESDLTEEQKQFQLHEWACENLIEQVLFRQVAQSDETPVPQERIDEIFDEMCSQSQSKEEYLKKADTTEEELRKQIVVGLKIERLHNQILEKASSPSETDLEEYYNANPDQFQQPELVHAAHIVLHAEPGISKEKLKERIFDLYQQLQNGTSFETVATQYSSCPDNGGDLGWFPRGHMVQSFENVVFALEQDAISEPFETEFGWHIAKVIEKSPEQTVPFEQIKEVLSEQLEDEYKQNELNGFIDAEKLKADIKR